MESVIVMGLYLKNYVHFDYSNAIFDCIRVYMQMNALCGIIL